ncbi:NAD(P)-dependent glycerol-1-phosphate dehydrogenase [Methanonatronarchaeum sp. AMET-Sl]|uniref:NAD(P)-dependent glycerol-1-phosphate dehydrogenase n=1 Tax=Methanonatronarchaeum sp. AMET-Sl TaxID=3037654 RepID=UPI00244E130F|nr:NAD(P)-dependent glycerol-1-phosphate dehydrogenase [Methanonatronarchaeum sp. AMET-Sl]WGI17289.1 NAD(P)-dependent glycerol-1-phosphate dehydrogenase [Methanonatronarchaeum sp. AMET-Sl]
MLFEKSKLMKLPRNVLIGHKVIERSAELCNDLGLNGEVIIATGPTTRKVAGQLTADTLEENGYEPNLIEIEKASHKEVDRVVELGKELDNKFIVGVGGGKVIDVAKVASSKLKTQFISVPTAASHDGIASGRASIMDGEDKVSVESTPPIGVIADTYILSKAPWRLTCSGCADIISNYTAIKDWELARKLRNDEYSNYSAALSKMTAEELAENRDSIKKGLEESAWIVVKGLISSGVAMSIAGSSRPASGAEHKFSHMLDRIAPKPALHGEQCGVGSILMMYLHGGDWKDLKYILKEIGAPTDAETLNIDPETIIKALTNAHKIRPERYTILGNEGLTKEAARKLAKETEVI